MDQLYKNIRTRRKELGMSQQELANRVGYTDRASIAKIEAGKVDLSQSKIVAIAEALRVDPIKLFGWDDESDVEPVSLGNHFVRIPVLGRVAAGVPIESIENISEDDFEDVAIHPGEEDDYFALRIKGDSMMPLIHPDSVVIVRQQPDAETGEIVIATVNGDDAVCKRLKKYADGIMLVSENPSYSPMVFRRDDINSLPIRILGKVVEVRTSI